MCPLQEERQDNDGEPLSASLNLQVCMGNQGCGQVCVCVTEGAGQCPCVHAGGAEHGRVYPQ